MVGRYPIVIALAAVALGGCERGCLSNWLSERGVGGKTPETTGRGTPSSALQGFDCSDGLLRCIDGQVEASRATHIPDSCAKGAAGERRATTCTCPWESVGACPSGCVENGLEVVAWPDAGFPQLCLPNHAVARPLLPAETESTEICATEGVTCVNETVRLCEHIGRPARLVGKCLNGCQAHIEIEPGETMDLHGVLSILCRRDDAERQ